MASPKSTTPMDVHIGNRIHMRRIMIGLSQEKLGERLGITFQQVQKYEKGTNRIGAGRLQEVADILGVQIRYFFDGQKERECAAAERGVTLLVDNLGGERAALQLLQAFTAIEDPKIRKALLSMAQALVQGAPEPDAIQQERPSMS